MYFRKAVSAHKSLWKRPNWSKCPLKQLNLTQNRDSFGVWDIRDYSTNCSKNQFLWRKMHKRGGTTSKTRLRSLKTRRFRFSLSRQPRNCLLFQRGWFEASHTSIESAKTLFGGCSFAFIGIFPQDFHGFGKLLAISEISHLKWAVAESRIYAMTGLRDRLSRSPAPPKGVIFVFHSESLRVRALLEPTWVPCLLLESSLFQGTQLEFRWAPSSPKISLLQIESVSCNAFQHSETHSISFARDFAPYPKVPQSADTELRHI